MMSAPRTSSTDGAKSDGPNVGTRVAAKQFAIALAADVMRILRRPRGWSRRLFPAVRMALLTTMVIVSAGAGAMLWVLNGIPLQVRETSEAPSILVEAADATPLGRVGSL